MGYGFMDLLDEYMLHKIYKNTMSDWRHKSIVLKRLEDFDSRVDFINIFKEANSNGIMC